MWSQRSRPWVIYRPCLRFQNLMLILPSLQRHSKAVSPRMPFAACCRAFSPRKLCGICHLAWRAASMLSTLTQVTQLVSSRLSFCYSMPNTTFSQNNGVISLTKCASRRAGYACGVWLIILGVFSKFAGTYLNIRQCCLMSCWIRVLLLTKNTNS
jgi:hypothetical protein